MSRTGPVVGYPLSDEMANECDSHLNIHVGPVLASHLLFSVDADNCVTEVWFECRECYQAIQNRWLQDDWSDDAASTGS